MKNTYNNIKKPGSHGSYALNRAVSDKRNLSGTRKTAACLQIFLITIILLLTRNDMSAQTLPAFTHYNTETGFVQKEVMKLVQDDKGQMWFATWNGLYKFDGNRFSNYKARPGDGVRMESNRLETICADGDNIWMQGYNGSISCFNRY